MFTKKKLQTLPYGQAYVRIYDNGDIDLISYSTVVIAIRDNWLQCFGLYWATTKKHIGKFMREYGFGDYYTAKELFIKQLKFNLETGEVVDI